MRWLVCMLVGASSAYCRCLACYDQVPAFRSAPWGVPKEEAREQVAYEGVEFPNEQAPSNRGWKPRHLMDSCFTVPIHYHGHTLPRQATNGDHRNGITMGSQSSRCKKRTPNQNFSTAPTNNKATWKGFLYSTLDALVVLEACLQNKLEYTSQRPREQERSHLITSGNVFVYTHTSSRIQRWTDGYAWSPSRVSGNFLVYRELSQPFPVGEARKIRKRTHKQAFHLSENHGLYPRMSISMHAFGAGCS